MHVSVGPQSFAQIHSADQIVGPLYEQLQNFKGLFLKVDPPPTPVEQPSPKVHFKRSEANDP